MNAQKMYKMEMQAEIDRLRNRFKPKQDVPEKQEKNVEKRDQLKIIDDQHDIDLPNQAQNRHEAKQSATTEDRQADNGVLSPVITQIDSKPNMKQTERQTIQNKKKIIPQSNKQNKSPEPKQVKRQPI